MSGPRGPAVQYDPIMVNRWTQRRQQRRRRREIGNALRSEFELERPRGFAALRELVRGVGELEKARMTARARALDEPTSRPARQRTPTRR